AKVVERARRAPHVAVALQWVAEAGAPIPTDPLRSTIVGITLAVATGEAYYLPLGHREHQPDQGTLALGDLDVVSDGDAKKASRKKRTTAVETSKPTSIAAKALASGPQRIRNLPALSDASMAPLRALLEDASVPKTLQNAKPALNALRRVGITLRGLEFD